MPLGLRRNPLPINSQSSLLLPVKTPHQPQIHRHSFLPVIGDVVYAGQSTGRSPIGLALCTLVPGGVADLSGGTRVAGSVTLLPENQRAVARLGLGTSGRVAPWRASPSPLSPAPIRPLAEAHLSRSAPPPFPYTL